MAGNKRRRIGGSFHSTGNDPVSVPASSSAMQPTFLSTFDRVSYYPIFSTLCNYLSIAEIVGLTRTCKKLSDLYQYLIPSLWDIDKGLQRYVDDPCGFRSQMAMSDALIFGDSALQFFERAFCNCHPLSVLIQQGQGLELFQKYLIGIEGYSQTNVIGYEESGRFCEIMTYERHSGSGAVIDVNITRDLPVQFMFADVRTTAEANIISWNKAYSLFPQPTFIQRKSYLLGYCDSVTRSAMRKLSRNGWDVQGVMWPEEERSNHPIRERRRVGDRYTWTIPFDTRKFKPPKTPDYVLEHACISMDLSSSHRNDESWYGDFEDGEVRYYEIHANPLKSKVLKHTYLCGDLEMMDFFLRRLNSFTVVELHKLKRTERPSNYARIFKRLHDVDALLESFDRPASWTYRDDQISIWYKAFEKSKEGEQ